MTNHTRQHRVFCALSFLLASSIPLRAQTTGTINGNVTDSSGALVPAATVTATLIDQQVRRAAISNSEGFYSLSALPPGRYSIAVEKTGFQRSEQTGVILTLNQNLRLDITLEVGQAAQTVSVTADTPLVDTRSGTLAGLVDDRRMVDLPINGRNVIGLANMLPGVVSVNAPQQLTDARSGPTLNVNGSLENQNYFTLNGGVFLNPSRNTGMNFPPPDAVQEFSIQTQNFTAEYGRNAGAQINVVSRSGSNTFHGTLWEFLRNDKLNARNFFASRVSGRKQNQYGAAAGGAIIPNRLFGFGSWQGLRDRAEAIGAQSVVPSTAQRNGDFTALSTTLRNPVDALTGQPFTDSTGAPCVQGNVVRQGCISPVAKSLMPLIPESPSGRYTVLSPAPQNGSMVLGRVDWNHTDRHNLYGNVFIDANQRRRPTLISGNIPDYLSDTLSQRTTTISLHDTYTFSPNLVNEVIATYLRSASLSSPDEIIEPSSLGINMPLYAEAGGPSISVGSNIVFGGGSGRVDFKSNNWQLRDVAAWTTGRHNLKFGGEYLKLSFRQLFVSPPNFNFNGTRSGNEFADFLMGAYFSLSANFGVRTNDNLQTAPSLFVQDDIRVNRRLTLSFGLRWEPYFPWVDRYDRLQSLAGISTRAQSTRFPTAPPGILFAGDPGVPRGITSSDLNNFAPRFGFAWDIFGDGKTSVRGAYGIFYDSIKADSVSQENAPWAGNIRTSNGRIENPFTSVGQTAPPVAPQEFNCYPVSAFPGVQCSLFPLPLSGLYISSQMRTPYIQSWNLTVQRQLTASTIVEASYIGKAGIKIEGYRNFNPGLYISDPVTGAAPSLQNVNNRTASLPGILAPNAIMLDNSFRSWYNGLQTQVRQRFSHGLSFNFNYTWSKALDTMSSNIYGRLLDNPLSVADNKGRADFDRTHVFAGSWVWSPTLGNRQGFVSAIFNDWTLSGLHQWQTGSPFSIRAGTDIALDGSGSRQRASLRPGAGPITLDHPDRNSQVQRYFNTDAFLRAAESTPGTYGNSGRNIIEGPAFGNTNFAVLRDFPLKERLRLQFRSEFFNLFNQVRLGSTNTTGAFNDPDNSVTSATFGRIRTAAPAREIQFALKLIW